MAHALHKNIDSQMLGEHTDQTYEFYEANAEKYFNTTVSAKMEKEYSKFLEHIPQGGLILDAGSGSGRDTRIFLSRGFRVEAFDASTALAELSSAYTGQNTQVATFEDWRAQPGRFDGIWAFASLLHVKRTCLVPVLAKLGTSLKSGGWLFASFKYGRKDTYDNLERSYTNMTITSARALFSSVGLFDEIEVWRVSAPAAHGETTQWVYILARKP